MRLSLRRLGALTSSLDNIGIMLTLIKLRPLVVIFKQATGSKAATIALTMIILTVVVFSAIEVLTSSSRLTAAFASHGGLPFGKT